jgi:hypothetical protein
MKRHPTRIPGHSRSDWLWRAMLGLLLTFTLLTGVGFVVG